MYLKKDKKVNRRDFLRKSSLSVAAVCSGVLGTGLIGCGKADKQGHSSERPNILILVPDDAGWRDVGYHGSEIKTPNIDKLMQAGVELDQFYVYPTCSPTRASLLSGRYASRFGILGPIAMRSTQTLPADDITLAELLRRNGYATAITGKWHLGLRPQNGPRQYGFEYTYGYLHGQIDQYTHRYKNGDQSWHRNDVFIEEEGHATDLIAKEAIRYIRELRDKTKPFFLYVPFSVPHYPLQEEEKWTAPYHSIENKSRRLFAASVTHMDNAIGQLIDVLEEEKLREQTLIIFLSDNGAQEKWSPTFEYNGKYGPYDRLGDNRPLRDWKGSLYEGGIRVPAFINWPEKLRPGKVHQVVDVVDIYPTVAAVAGASIPPDVALDGMNVWQSIAQGEPVGERTLYWRTPYQMALRKGDWKLVHTGETLDQGVNELYNLADDPGETRNRAQSNAQTVTELMEELKRQVKLDNVQ